MSPRMLFCTRDEKLVSRTLGLVSSHSYTKHYTELVPTFNYL